MAGCSGCHRPKLFKSLVDLCQETHRIEPQVLVCQYVSLLLGQHIRVQESSVWSLGGIIHFVNPGPHSGLDLQLHHRLEEIDVASGQPVYPVELVQSLLGPIAITYATRGYPPTLIFHGTSDTRVHHHQTIRFFEKLEQAGVPVDLHLYAGQDHFFDREPHFYQAVADAIALFISRYVPLREPVASA